MAKETKDYVWKLTRYGFWAMIVCWIISFITQTESFMFGGVFVAVSILTFVCSIIHLTKHKKKAFAITALVISSIPILAFLVGIVYGVTLALG